MGQLLMFAALAAQMCMLPADQARYEAAQAAAVTCISRETARLEPSSEPAQDVATASLVACAGEKNEMLNVLAACNPRLFLEMQAKLDDAARAAAVRTVVEIRAKRHLKP